MLQTIPPQAYLHTGDLHAPVRYRPDIDGLRAVAVLPVVFFHAGLARFGGGFVGVDIFFVISGYLIMSTIAADMDRGRFTILGFYERRIRRIFPALFVMAFVSSIVAAFVLPPADFTQFGKSLVAMAAFVSNLFFRYFGDQGGYFDTRWEPQLLLHTWSLSVEEQFYILLPPGLMFLRRRTNAAKTLRVLAIICLASFLLSALVVHLNQKDAFFNVLTRAWELMIGSLLALRAVPPITSQIVRESAAALGLAMIAYAIFLFSNNTMFPGPSALMPCVGAVLIIYAGESGPSWTSRLLSWRPIVFVGLISYSLYLWHWPIVVLAKRICLGTLSDPWIVLVVAASLVAATLSWRFVERPFRGRASLFDRRQILTMGGIAGGAAVVLGLVIAVAQGLPGRYDLATRTILAQNFERQYDVPKGHCTNWLRDLHEVGEIAECRIGTEAKSILFLGDSQVEVLRPLVQRLHDENALGGRGALFTISAGCPPAMSANTDNPAFHCHSFFKLALERAKASDVDTVFIAFAAWWDQGENLLCQIRDGACGRQLSKLEAEDVVLADFRRTISELKASGKRVIVSLPAPIYSLKVPVFEINEVTFGSLGDKLRRDGLIPTMDRSDFLPLRDKLRALVTDLGAELYDLRGDLCKGDVCVYQHDHVSIYVDNFHLATSQVGIHHDSLRQALQ